MELDATSKDAVFRWVTVCEILYGQTTSYYEKQLKQNVLIPFDFGRYHLLISGLDRKVYRPYFGMDAFDYTKYFRQVEGEICEILRKQHVDCMSAMMLYDHSKRFALVFSTPENITAHDVAEIVSSCFNRLYSKIFDMGKIPYRNYTIVSDEIHGYDCMNDALKTLNALSRQQFFDMKTMIMTPALLRESIIPVSREQIHEDITFLRTAIRERDEQSAGKAFNGLFDHLRGARDFELLSGALHAIRSLCEGMLASCGRELEEPEIFAVGQYPTFDHLREGLHAKLVQILSSLPEGPAMSAPVLEAVRYIRHHFREDVSLADVARHIDMSPSWLTKRFNQECAMSIPQYLLSVRMERAKKLLSETNMLVFEVAGSVGFDNPRYFVSVFKKETGFTPTAYREQIKKD